MKAKDYLTSIGYHELEGNLNEIINKFNGIKKTYASKFDGLNVRIDTEYEALQIYGLREETEKEKDIRVKKEELQKEEMLKYEKAQFEHLKKKFGNI